MSVFPVMAVRGGVVNIQWPALRTSVERDCVCVSWFGMALTPGIRYPALLCQSHPRFVCNKLVNHGQTCHKTSCTYDHYFNPAVTKAVREQSDRVASLSQQLQHFAFERKLGLAQRTSRNSSLCRKDEYDAEKKGKWTRHSGNWHQQVAFCPL